MLLYLFQVNNLAFIGGNDVKDNVHRVLGATLVHEVAGKYNWSGKSRWKNHTGETKLPFSGLRLCVAIQSEYDEPDYKSTQVVLQ